ncbi:MAG: copper chaperone PCu(A)C [Lysobacteraceae bacterium]
MKTRILLIVAAASLIASATCIAVTKAMTMPMAKLTPASETASKPAQAHVDAAWVRAAPPGAMMMAGYMAIHNHGKTPLRFVSAQCDAFGMVELHQSLIVNGMSTMRAAGEQTIPAGGTLQIQPGGLHLMLMQPKHALKIGDSVRFQLHFADGSSVDVVAPVSTKAPL